MMTRHGGTLRTRRRRPAAIAKKTTTSSLALLLGLVVATSSVAPSASGYTVVPKRASAAVAPTFRSAASASTSIQMSTEQFPDPTTFREAEILGLRLMQEGNFEEALAAFQMGMKLPGCRPDIRRTRSLQGPSPVGGSFGGTDSQYVLSLDDFELQAAHYNMACAHARLGNIDDATANLAKAFQNGFDNYATVRGDPDLDPIKMSPDFEALMEAYDSKNGFNPFGFFGKK